jgi:hypothetical protein
MSTPAPDETDTKIDSRSGSEIIDITGLPISSLPITGLSERDAAMRGIRTSLRQPGVGETRELGYLISIECSSGGMLYRIKTISGETVYKPVNKDSVPVRLFTPDLGGLNLTCGTKAIDYPAVFIYRKEANGPATLMSLEFVPRSFALEN